ncbi:MAG: alpha/beta hydrolase [Rhodoferax sp.]
MTKEYDMLTLRRITGPQGQLAVDDAGRGGLPILLVHADAGNFTQWREALDHLRRRRRAIALDLRGHGRSEKPADGDMSIGGRCADVAAVADALGLERFMLVGHSGGGIVALQYAAQNAKRVAGLLLVDPAVDGRQLPADKRQQFTQLLRSPEYSKTANEFYASIAGANAEVTERVLWDLQATPPETVIGTFEALAAHDPLPALQAYRGPRLMLVTPASDTPASIRRLDASLPYRTVACTGHWLQLDEPDAFHRTADEFIGHIE